MAEQYVLSMNDQLRRDELPVVFRAAVAFPVSEGGYVTFGTPDFPDIDKAKAEASESKDIICFNCQQPGHTAKKCPKPSVKRCKNCDEVGHNVSNCSQPIKCTTCGSQHHTRHDCPESAKPTEGKAKGSRKRDKSDPPDVAAELRFYLHDQHISHLSVHLRFGYHRNDTDTKLTYTNSDLMLYHANTKGIKATIVDVNEKLLETRATVFGVDKDKLAAWIATGQLYMVNLEYCPSSSAKNIGTNFFTFNSMGEFSDQFERVRSFLCEYAVSPRNQESVLIQAIVRSTGEIAYKTSELNTQMLAQAKFDPMAKWYEHGLNCQMGMAIAKADRPNYVLPAKATFFNIAEYLTVFYHGITDIHENLDETQNWMHVNVRFAALPFSGRKYIMFIEMRPSLRLTPGDRVKVCLNWYEDQRKHDWIAEVVTPVPFATSQDYTSILSRPYISDDDTDEGHFDNIELPKDSVIEVTDQEDTEKVRSMITTMNPMEVTICLQVSTEPTRRQINALRQLQQGHENNVDLKDTCKILTANNLRSLETVDAFAHLVKLAGEEKLQQVINNQCKLHNKEQRQADAELRNLPGGLLLIQGSPGTGKTAWIVNNIAVCYSFATDQDPTQIVVLSGSNAPLDDLAVSIYTRLLSIYNSDTTAYKYPVVIREHSVDTEIQVYRKEETGKRKEIIGTRAPAPIRDDIDMSKLAVAQMLLKTYERVISRKYTNITDRRVQQLDLSLGTWMLRVAGLHIHDGKPHPIAHPDEKRFGMFREFLIRYGTGQEFSSHDNTKFTDAAADLRDYVHSMADVQLTTLNNYHQSKVYGEMEPHIIFVDEAAKAPEGDAISAFVWNNAPARIFVGDIFQIKPNSSVGEQEKLSPFAKQMNMSFFSRALYAGYKTVWFTTQHRYANGINNLLNHLGYVDLKTHKDVENRYPVQRAKDLLKKTFDIKGSIMFLDLPSGTREKLISQPVQDEPSEHQVGVLHIPTSSSPRLGAQGYRYCNSLCGATTAVHLLTPQYG